MKGGFRTGAEVQEKREEGKEGRKLGMKERRDSGRGGYGKGRETKRRVKEVCETGEMLFRRDRLRKGGIQVKYLVTAKWDVTH